MRFDKLVVNASPIISLAKIKLAAPIFCPPYHPGSLLFRLI